MKTGKIWGETSMLFSNETTQLHRIRVDKGGYCSTHKHEHRNNLFYVEQGRLLIRVKKADQGLDEKTELGPGDSMTVGPGDLHSFEGLGETIAFELYFPAPVLDSDIVRENVGGKKGAGLRVWIRTVFGGL